MTTAANIIQRSLFKLRASSPINPAPPELTKAVYDELVSMLEAWEKQGYNTGILVPDSRDLDTKADLSEPLDATDAIVNNLAIKCAGLAGKEADFQLKIDAERTRNEVEKEYRWQDAPDLEPSGILGEGDQQAGYINIRSLS